MQGMIDLHCHILYGLDDGPETLAESLDMCRMGYRDGIRVVVATPHTLNGVYQNDRVTILARVQELNEMIIQFGTRNSEFGIRTSHLPSRTPNSAIESSSLDSAINNPQSAIDFRVLPGADVHLSEHTIQQLKQGKVTTLCDNKKFILIEFPSQGIPYKTEEVLLQLIRMGITPIISHPERNLEIARRPDRYYGMINMGCLGQVTAMSLTGAFGPGARRVSEKLLAHRLVHFIASDAHSFNGRPPILSPAVRAAVKILGEDEVWKMVTEYPQAVLDGKRPNVREPMGF
jgi:protein-tyrosine phosphatase